MPAVGLHVGESIELYDWIELSLTYNVACLFKSASYYAGSLNRIC